MTITLRIVRGRPHGRCLQLAIGEYLFGRGAECAFQPRSEWVSRQHCIVRVSESGATVCDLGSRNGTLVNGILTRDEFPLSHGDHLQIGPLVFEVRESAEVPLQVDLTTVGGCTSSGEGDESPTQVMDPVHSKDTIATGA